MGFLGFMKKKQGTSTSSNEPLDIPLPPPSMNGEDSNLPKFADENPVDELNLPDIPDFEQPGGAGDVPEIPDFMQKEQTQEMPAPAPKFETKQSGLKIPESDELEMPAMPSMDEPPEIEMPSPEENAYNYTPAKGARQLFPQHEEMPMPRGEIFIRGDDYREVLEGIDELLAIQKEKTEKQERQVFRTDEKQLEKFEATIEDMQRSLVIAEKILFE